MSAARLRVRPALAAAGLAVMQHCELMQVAPHAKITAFTADAELQARATAEPAVDASLPRTESSRLLPLARRLTGLDAPST